MYVSFNDGDVWQPLRFLNMSMTSVRDLVLHDDDIVVGTHGRSFWILTTCRFLRKLRCQRVGFRRRGSLSAARDLSVPAEQEHRHAAPARGAGGEESSDGAIIYYFLKRIRSGPVTLEILRRRREARAALLQCRRHPTPFRAISTSRPTGCEAASALSPRQARIVSPGTSVRRLVGASFGYPISAIVGDTPKEPLGPAVLPGTYTVKLTAGGKGYTATVGQ